MKTKRLAVILTLSILVISYTFGLVSAAVVTGSLYPNPGIIYVGNSVTLTCTYIYTPDAGETKTGQGCLEVTGPYSTPKSSFGLGTSWTVIAIWGTSDPYSGDPLISGEPVTHNQQLDSVGYYYFRWLCKTIDGSLAGAYVIVEVQVIDEPPPPVPEGSSVAVLAISLASVGAFATIAKRRNSIKKV